ncbi:MAG: asparaginase [Cyanobacteria bacterium J06592_8]
MTRAKRTQSAELEVRLLRSGLCESVHRVYATVCDTRGRVLSSAGSSEKGTFVRSALKPFQALAITTTGTLERYDLTDIDLAIVCSSHQGTIEQARRAFNILWHCHVDPAYLQCPIPKGKRSPLQHGCSGKHAAMLAVSQQRHWPLETYLQPKHPVQQLITNKVAEMLKLPPDELIVARDDCGAPTYYLELSQIATLFALLASGENLDLERIVRAMTQHPEMVAGEGHLDTELMRMTEGELVSKSGAEGIQCIGRIGQGMGLAIKVIDGAKRAKYAVAIQLLKQMGWITPTQSETLSEKFLTLDDYRRLEVVGELSLI